MLGSLDLDYPTGLSFALAVDFKEYHGFPVSGAKTTLLAGDSLSLCGALNCGDTFSLEGYNVLLRVDAREDCVKAIFLCVNDFVDSLT